MLTRFGLLIGFFLFSFYVVKALVKKPEPVVIYEDEYEAPKLKKKSARRSPSSLFGNSSQGKSEPFKPGYRETKRDERNFAPDVERPDESEGRDSSPSGSGYSSSYASGGGGSYQSRSGGGYVPSSKSKSAKSDSSKPQTWNSVGVSAPTAAIGGTAGGASGGTTGTTTGGTTGSGGSNSGGGGYAPITCSANQGAGTYNSPIMVSLSNSSTGQIRYNLSDAGCVSPSQSYTAGIVVGASDGQYCLSYYCEDSSGHTSDVQERIFTITSGAPALQASHPIIQYQTTELVGTSFLTSTDFGRADYEIGQVNLRVDPGANGCDYLHENYVMYPPSTPPSPTPFQILASLAMNTINPGSQIEVPLVAQDLDYGDNFIMSYIVDNRDPVTPQYACSTQRIVLHDFEYFDGSTIHGDVGTPTVREFSGGFSPYGFFEEESVIYRGPAGVSGENQDGQSLESGFFQIFF